MVNGELITISGLLDYLYSRFAVTYIMCFLGVIISKVLKITVTGNKNKPITINGLRLVSQGALITVIMCAAQDYLRIKSFNLYVLVCVFTGIWSPAVVRAISDMKLVKMFIVNISRKAKDPIVSAVGETIDQIDELNDENKKDDSTDENQQGGSA